MPSYLYRCTQTRRELVLIRPVDRRDDPVTEEPGDFARVTVPQTITIRGAAADPWDMGAQVLAGFRKQEEREGARFQSEWTPEQIRAAWAEPDPPEPAADHETAGAEPATVSNNP